MQFGNVPAWVIWSIVNAYRDGRLVGENNYEKLFNAIATYQDVFDGIGVEARQAMNVKVAQDKDWRRYQATWQQLVMAAMMDFAQGGGRVMRAPTGRVAKKMRMTAGEKRAMKNAELFGFKKESWQNINKKLNFVLTEVSQRDAQVAYDYMSPPEDDWDSVVENLIGDAEQDFVNPVKAALRSMGVKVVNVESSGRDVKRMRGIYGRLLSMELRPRISPKEPDSEIMAGFIDLYVSEDEYEPGEYEFTAYAALMMGNRKTEVDLADPENDLSTLGRTTAIVLKQEWMAAE